MAAITDAQYKRISDKEWKGVRVRSILPLRNSMCSVPVGTLFTIEGKFSGFSILADPCSCCGVAPSFSKVSPSKLERI